MAEKPAVHGPSAWDLVLARSVEKAEWKRTLPFYARPWFWIVLTAVIMTVEPAATTWAVIGLVVYGLWYAGAKRQALRLTPAPVLGQSEVIPSTTDEDRPS